MQLGTTMGTTMYRGTQCTGDYYVQRTTMCRELLCAGDYNWDYNGDNNVVH